MRTRCGLRTLLLAFALSAHGAVHAQGPQVYPARPIRWIVDGAPGSPPDYAARVINEHVAALLGQPVVVDNRPGAAGTIALTTVAKAAPDGYTLGIVSLSQMAAPGIFRELPYDITRDFAAVVELVRTPLLAVVRSGTPMRSVADLIAEARAKPGQLTFASAGNATPSHLAAALFQLQAGVTLQHVPFRSGPPALVALLGDEVDMMFTPPAMVAGYVRAGKLRALATTASSRNREFPEVPTLSEAGFPGMEITNWFGALTKAGTPPAIVGRIAGEFQKALAESEVAGRYAALGMDPVLDAGPSEFGVLVRSELERWSKVVRDADIRAD
jgi:tripartite-type tricarboxylate transporter receptor subunit TctC